MTDDGHPATTIAQSKPVAQVSYLESDHNNMFRHCARNEEKALNG